MTTEPEDNLDHGEPDEVDEGDPIEVELPPFDYEGDANG